MSNCTENKKKLTPADLRQFTGSLEVYRHILNRNMVYTEGVQYFAEHAGCYWFLDIVATELTDLLNKHGFLLVKMFVADSKAKIVAENGNGKALYERAIDWTDCPPGQWDFYYTDNTFLLPLEY